MGYPEIDLQSYHRGVMVSAETLSSSMIEKRRSWKECRGRDPLGLGLEQRKPLWESVFFKPSPLYLLESETNISQAKEITVNTMNPLVHFKELV